MRMKTCISAMLLQSGLNIWRLSHFFKLDKYYTNSVSTKLLQRSKINFKEYINQIFPKNYHIHLRNCDAASSYHCPSPTTGYKI